MESTAKRLAELRKSVGMSQIKMAKALGISSAMIARIELNKQIISDKILCLYADYFDVSLDYICGRTDKPEGKLFTARPNLGEDNEEIRQFVEMCFDPKSKMSVKLKDAIYRMMAEDKK